MIDKMDLNNKAISIRKTLGEDESSPLDIFSLAQTIENLTLLFYPLGNNISGACFKNKLSALIVINSDMSIGRQRFSLAHELYHYYFDKEMTSIICSSAIGTGNENETKADQFASYFLMPPAALYAALEKYKSHSSSKLSLDTIIRIEQYFGISHKAMLFRLKCDKQIKSDDFDAMQTGVIHRAALLGFDTSLYSPSADNKKIQVLGYYLHKAKKLLDEEIISQGKYEEFLLDAFRDDIVFGLGLENDDITD